MLRDGKITAKKHMGILRNVERFPVRASCLSRRVCRRLMSWLRGFLCPQYFVERMEDLVGAGAPGPVSSASGASLRLPPGQKAAAAAAAAPAVSAQVRSLLDDAYRRVADALLSHLLDAEIDRTNSEEKGLRHVHVFIAGTQEGEGLEMAAGGIGFGWGGGAFAVESTCESPENAALTTSPA